MPLVVTIGCFDETSVTISYATAFTATGVKVVAHTDGDHAFKMVLQPDATSYSFLLS